MKRASTDTIIAVLLLLFCGLFFWASFQIRDLGFESLGAEVWPQIILALLLGLSLLYLVRSIREAREDDKEETLSEAGLGGWYAAYRNVIWSFVAFGVFLVTLPYLGMLIGGVLFVFVALTLLGGYSLRDLLIHAAIALVTVGAMWAVFTFGLRVILPEGVIFSVV